MASASPHVLPSVAHIAGVETVEVDEPGGDEGENGDNTIIVRREGPFSPSGLGCGSKEAHNLVRRLGLMV